MKLLGYALNFKAYSSNRTTIYGHGINVHNLQVKNETWALWTWYRNQDSEKKEGDEIYIVRQPYLCPDHQKKVTSRWFADI